MENDFFKVVYTSAFKPHGKVIKFKVGNLRVKELCGIAASRGQHVGKVKIVQTVDELSKVEDGDVLVTKATTPEFLSGIVKAGAVVTDRGGITSHAAIISREFGRPCVVGCVKATSILRDNMIVTVDGTTGVVSYQ